MSLSDYEKAWCGNLHHELMKWVLTQPFRIPVDPERDNAPDYFQIVKNPMDLGTVKRKLTEGRYTTAEEFVDDVKLICDNAILFNGENSMFGYIAADIKQWVEAQFEKRAHSHEEEWQRRLQSVVERLHKHIEKAPPEESDSE